MNEDTTAFFAPAEIERDFARSAWFDRDFAIWFAPYAIKEVLFGQTAAADFFAECGAFANVHKSAPGSSGDPFSRILRLATSKTFFTTLGDFPPLPGGKMSKPTSWQMEKARKYLGSRHNTLLARKLADAEQIRAEDPERADRIASDARRAFSSFSDSTVPCRPALSDIDSLVALAESNPPLFTVEGELGRLLNGRLKPDNLGIFLADPKVGKTTDLVSLAVRAAEFVPTLFISTGDESERKVNARIATNLSFKVTQPEFSGRYAMPVPDCQHNASGSCPIGKSGEPRQTRSWKALIEDGAEPLALADGTFDGSRSVSGAPYVPCARCYPKGDGSREDAEARKNWRSAIWWRAHEFGLADREDFIEARKKLETCSGSLRVAAYASGKFGIDTLEALLDTLDRTENFVPRVIVIDYADLMRQEQGRESDKDHDGMRRIWEGLRAITSTYNILLLTATQTNRAGDEIETHTRKTIGRSAKAADNCTWLVSLNQTVVEKRAKVMRASMMYAREGRFDPEHQALCAQWHEIQDGFPFSVPVFCKIKNETKGRNE